MCSYVDLMCSLRQSCSIPRALPPSLSLSFFYLFIVLLLTTHLSQTAALMDRLGNLKARQYIAMIKVAVPRAVVDIIDKAIQAHGGMGTFSGNISFLTFS